MNIEKSMAEKYNLRAKILKVVFIFYGFLSSSIEIYISMNFFKIIQIT